MRTHKFPGVHDTSTASARAEPDDVFWLQHQVDSWSGKHVARWIEGLGDFVNPFLGTIRDHIRSGAHLRLVDSDTLTDMGISGLGSRKMILQAIQLLDYFCNEAPNENLQSLALKTSVACNAVVQVLRQASRQRDKAKNRAEIVSVLNSVGNSVDALAEHTKRLVFWLDRSPFDENCQYIDWRNQITNIVYDIVKGVNTHPLTMFNSVNDIINRTNDLREVCDFIVKRNDDPAVLFTANVEKAVLRRKSSQSDWGLNLQSSYRGVHVISEIKEDSPADHCGKIDAGDEVLMINGKTVIGWDLTRVAKRLGNSSDTELHLIVNKRPRDSVPVPVKDAGKTQTKPLAKVAPGCQTTFASNERSFTQDFGLPLDRRRSTTAIKRALRIASEQCRLRRRASISCGRERERPSTESGTSAWNLLELIGEPEARVVRRAKTMRHQPDGYVRSYINNRLVHDFEDDTVADQIPFNVKFPKEFAAVTIVTPEELSRLGVAEPKASDSDWSAPVNDAATHRFRAPTGDSNLSGFSIDSPKQFLTCAEDSYVLPSPSTSSMNSVSSPAPFRLLNSTDWPGSGDDVPPTPSTPFGTGDKLFEGWVRRRKTGTELSEPTNKWPKCWMCLRGQYLSTYPNQYAKRADITINIAKCTVSDQIDIKTSKKFVFRLRRPSVDYHFSCYSLQDMKNWIVKIQLANELYGNPGRVMSKSVSYFNESDAEGQNSHYNTLSGLPSLMSHSAHEDLSNAATSTLPRPGLLASFTHRHGQSVLKSKK